MNSGCTDFAFEPNRYHVEDKLTRLPSPVLTQTSGLPVAAGTDKANTGSTPPPHGRPQRRSGSAEAGERESGRGRERWAQAGPDLTCGGWGS